MMWESNNYVGMASGKGKGKGKGKACIISLATKGRLVYAASDSGVIYIFQNLSAGTGASRLAEIGYISSATTPAKALLVQESRIFTGHHDNKVRVWNVSMKGEIHSWQSQSQFPSLMSSKLVKTLPTIKDCIQNFIKPGSFIQIRRHRKELWMKHVDAVTALALCMEDDILYSASWDKTVKIWRLSDFKCMESIYAHEDAVNAVACARNGILFTGSADGTVRVWRKDYVSPLRYQHKHVTTLKIRNKEAVNCLEMSRDESILYCGTSGGDIKYWTVDINKEDGYKADALSGHKRSVLCLTTLKNFVCSGSADATIRVWMCTRVREIELGIRHSCVAILKGHSAPVKCITACLCSSPSSSSSSSPSPKHCSYPDYDLTSNGFLLYSGSLDGTLKSWSVYTTGGFSVETWCQ